VLLSVVLAPGGNSPHAAGPLPGALVVEAVPAGSPAAKAGIRPGDRLVSYDGKPLLSPLALLVLEDNTFKKAVTLRSQRGDETLTLTVPTRDLGWEVRPDLSPRVLTLYEEGRAAMLAGHPDETAARWKATAEAALAGPEGTPAPAHAAWLYFRAAEVQRATFHHWSEAREELLTARRLLQSGGDAASQAFILGELGRTEAALGNFAQAQEWRERALEVMRLAGNDWSAAGVLHDLGWVSLTRGHPAEAREYYRRALEIRQRWATLNDALSEHVATTLLGLANVALSQGDLDSAEDGYRRVLAIRERLWPNSPSAGVLANLGQVKAERGQLQEARNLEERALAIYERSAAKWAYEIANCLNTLGVIAWKQADFSRARACFERALQVFERDEPNSLAIADSWHGIGLTARAEGDLQGARDGFGRALALREQEAPDAADTALELTSLGSLAVEQGRPREALPLFERAVRIIENQRRQVPSTEVRALLVGLYLVRTWRCWRPRWPSTTPQPPSRPWNGPVLAVSWKCSRSVPSISRRTRPGSCSTGSRPSRTVVRRPTRSRGIWIRRRTSPASPCCARRSRASRWSSAAWPRNCGVSLPGMRRSSILSRSLPAGRTRPWIPGPCCSLTGWAGIRRTSLPQPEPSCRFTPSTSRSGSCVNGLAIACAC
jgi:tetratricopeptide (TPR) repeat protein